MEKKYWQSPEEIQKGNVEFLSPPAELDVEDQSDLKNGVTRREFLRLMGATMVMASAAACSRKPVEKIIPYLNKPEEITPGNANWYASTCGECPAACGILAKTREGRPIKLEGNPDHPLNNGKMCARGQASLLNLYDPDRLREPLKNGMPVMWQDVDQKLGALINKTKERGGKICLLTSHIHSPSTQKLIREFGKQVASATEPNYFVFEPLSLESLTQAQTNSYMENVIPRYRFDKADYILSFGADFLDTWLSPVEFTKDFASKRNLKNGKMSRFVAFESVLTVTGSNADLRVPVRRGDESLLALAIANEIVVVQKHSSFASDSGVVSYLSEYPIEKVSKWTGVQAEVLHQAAKELWQHRGKGLVLGGGYSAGSESAITLQTAVNFLNSCLENEGVTVEGNGSVSQQADKSGSYAGMGFLMSEMKEGKVDILLIYNTNPSYALPKSFGFGEALKGVGTVVYMGEKVNETAKGAHWVLPTPHYLESWGDAEPQKGLYSFYQPAIAPLYNTRSFQDNLLKWLGSEQKWEKYLKNYWKENLFPAHGGSSSFLYFWESTLRKGVLDTRKSGELSSPRRFNRDAFKFVSPKRRGEGLQVVLYPTVAQFDGRSANNSWLQELPDPISKITWRNFVGVAPGKAKELKLREGDVVKVTSASGDFSSELAVHVQPGLHPSTLGIPLGYGHTDYGKVANGVGVNGFEYVAKADAGGADFYAEAVVKKTGKWVRFAMTQGHQTMEGRPIISETTLAEYRKDPHAGNHSPEHLPSMWSEFKYEGYHWGMSVDLNTCTGCSACMIACQAENNIPSVGEKQVRKGREMHWIRIDRYYAGEEENPEVIHQPMLCQQCDNAPCETVCPTLATIHNEEGLNVQAYNRCVGTRYCANNCPYKVRRFNWHEYLWKTEPPLAMALNPDVSVREKGVMEKCTFCVQRIQEAKGKAKDEGRVLRDGEIQTACQQSCPANAIVFGDMNNPKSEMMKLAKEERGYHVLEELNTRPSITYLTKVRNKA